MTTSANHPYYLPPISSKDNTPSCQTSNPNTFPITNPSSSSSSPSSLEDNIPQSYFSDDCCTIIGNSCSSSTSSSPGDSSPSNESCLSSYSSCSSLDSHDDDLISSSSSFPKILANDKQSLSNKNNNKLLSRLINNGHNHSDLSNNSSDSLSTFILSDPPSQQPAPSDLKIETSNHDPLPPSSTTNSLPISPTKKLKPSLKLSSSNLPSSSTLRKNLLTRSNSVPLFSSSKKSVKFPANDGLENIVFFKKNDTPLSVSGVPSSDDEDYDEESEEFFDNDSFKSEDFFISHGKHHTTKHFTDNDKVNFLLDHNESSDDEMYHVPSVSERYWKLVSSNIKDLINSSSPPSRIANFNSNVQVENLCLAPTNLLVGNILVKNLAFEKIVGIKLTINNWSSFQTLYAHYIESLHDNQIDRFQFTIDLDKLVGNSSTKKLNVKFCGFYQSKDHQYWDNNGNMNYQIRFSRHGSSSSLSPSTAHKNFNHSINQISRSNISMLNELLSNSTKSKPKNRANIPHQDDPRIHSRYFPEDNIDNWFNHQSIISQPSSSLNDQDYLGQGSGFEGKSHRRACSLDLDLHKYYPQTENFASINSKTYRDLVANYCFYESK
ncbi:protein phosphatase regulator [Saccharomycopsis crataegensis]|uniref:Protein phosphatase regulator n=1 Tax=Saccharomycopsis crataegensis TaxID=43959 RepID=A0AAV5QR21_9ASCO|nr:protein phosphatase regulator [Saccharomycopsis crataegensis]